MTIEQAIKEAIEGGWKPQKGIKTWTPEAVMANYCFQPTWAMMPSFWQSLGNALGWNKPQHFGEAQFSGAWEMEEEKARKAYRGYWHRFIDHLADGKTAQEFFESLG